MFERIVVGVDGSEGGLEALKLAIGLQKIHDSELLLLSVYLEHTMWEASVSYVNTELTGSTHSALQEYAREVARQCKEFAQAQGVEKVRSFYMGGGPARTIVKFCEDHDAQLIVLGSRGISASERYMLGSVSHKVTNTSTRPVLIV
ncbi:universal stress protein [Granulosicoccus antarcticus]|uniref:TRAP-T-associated universal stress protein TeaD n=1 Tax=Granulosicoccus antarcticus IMCC3135 TaxID=1192854 RepID=A0A2Z2NQ42_9GAMM|nr:universal stress protein [Granulosicoccus antarcticus]ASJ72071.1 TRAP-T-associated universal stress protein TeaD [Granulosicoccus antarcticus IMCC3135]